MEIVSLDPTDCPCVILTLPTPMAALMRSLLSSERAILTIEQVIGVSSSTLFTSAAISIVLQSSSDVTIPVPIEKANPRDTKPRPRMDDLMFIYILKRILARLRRAPGGCDQSSSS